MAVKLEEVQLCILSCLIILLILNQHGIYGPKRCTNGDVDFFTELLALVF